MEKTNVRRTGRKPKSDPADYRYSFRLNAGENSRFEQMLAESGAKDRTLFIKKAIFGGTLKVVKTDKATMDYYILMIILKNTIVHRLCLANTLSRGNPI